MEEANELRQLVDGLEQRLVNELPQLGELERETLVRLCHERIENMSSGFVHEMVAHRAPEPLSGSRHKAVAELEQKLDLLIDLRRKSIIDRSELELALGAAQREVLAFAAFRALSRRPFILVEDADLRDLGRLRERIASEHGQRGAMQQNPVAQSEPEPDPLVLAIDRLESALPSLFALVADLER